ncbi:hypothetical protein M2103_002461 [Ereboglobus sp. PH5-5]|uniref:hypothetical protein n=1 Tax=Ereboglobus sp. PH5-5 TaxID=2940529 RepID=UPI002404E933|nr:hypothetical protein [Ereboglobus sp. PH5-5]MDF9834219.1 hypothetical protein [Ereboglobus sp. PH5-5]
MKLFLSIRRCLRILAPVTAFAAFLFMFSAKSFAAGSDGDVAILPSEQDWSFERGPDPASTGTLEVSGKTILLTGDFSRGKRYVAAACAIRFPEVNRMSFKVYTNQKRNLIVFLTDSTGQIHLRRHPVKPREIQSVTVAWGAGKSKEFRGGANDGVVHLPITKASVLIDSAEVDKYGFCEISDARLFRPPMRKTAAFESFDARKITVDDSTFVEPRQQDWDFNRGPDPAAAGTLEISGKTIRLTGDFTRGKRYVAAECAIRFREVNRMSFKVVSDQEIVMVLLTDSTGQVHMQKHRVRPGVPKTISVRFVASKNFWDGAKDGVLHPPVGKVGILVHSDEVVERGYCEISDVRLFK